MNWITKNISEFLIDSANNFIDFVSDAINEFFGLAVNACNTKEVQGVVGVTSSIAITLVVAMVLKQILTIYVLETDGDPDADPLQLLVKAAQAIALIACNGAIFDLLLEMSTRFTEDIIDSINISDATGVVKLAIGNIVSGNIIFPLFCIIILVFLIILGIKAGLRGIELSLMKIAFPIFCVDLIGTNKERWNNFLASYIVTFFGYVLQILCVKIFIRTFLEGLGGDTLREYAIALGWLFMAIKTPEWLQKFVYTTGIGRSVSGAARTAPFMIMQMKAGGVPKTK